MAKNDKVMDVREIRTLNDEALLDLLEDQKETQFNLRFKDAFGQLEEQDAMRNVRLKVAKIKTVLRERELARQKESGNA